MDNHLPIGKKIMKKAVIFVSAVILSACTAQDAYVSMQDYNRDSCNKLIDASERSACLKRSSATSYDSYKKQRDDIKR